MIFWIGILVSAAIAWIAVKFGFFQIWTFIFNITVSIYLAVYLQPVIINIPSVGETPYGSVLSMLAVALASYFILFGISYTFFTGQFNVSFPVIFDKIGTVLLGFIAGYLIWSFLSLLICITPASQDTFVKGIGFTDKYQQTSVKYISRFCNLINAAVSSQEDKYSAEQTINKLINSAKSQVNEKTSDKPEQAESAVRKDVNTPADQNEPGRPPEYELKM